MAAQPSQPQPQRQRPYLPHPPPPQPAAINEPLPQHRAQLKTLQSMLNAMLIQTGNVLKSANIRAARAEPELTRRASIMADTDALHVFMARCIPSFHTALDDMEEEIVKARAIVARDLRVVRAKKAMPESESTTEEAKVEKEVEAAADAMADVAGGDAQGTQQPAAAQPTNTDLDVHMDMDSNTIVDEQGAGVGSTKAGQNMSGATQISGTLTLPHSDTRTPQDGTPGHNTQGADTTQNPQFRNPGTTDQNPPRPQPPSQSSTMIAQLRQMQLMHQRQAQQQQRQSQPQSQSHPHPPPPAHTPTPHPRTMPEDNIAFSALPSSTPPSPTPRPHPNPRPAAAILPPATHPLITQRGLNIPADSLPLLPEHMRSQMAQVHTQAVLEASGLQPPAPQGHAHPEFFVEEDNEDHTPMRNFTPPAAAVRNSMTEPFGGQGQDLGQGQQGQAQNSEEMEYESLFGAEGQDAAETDINFDDFFNDLAGGEGQSGGDQAAGAAGEFDLSTFGMETDAGGGGGGGAGNSGNSGNESGGGGAGGGGGGLGLGMLEGLERYANQATDEDVMDGLDFSIDNLPSQHTDNNNAQGQPAGFEGGGGGGSGQGEGQAFGMANTDLDLDAAMGMGLDQGSTFDDLLDGMSFGDGEGGGGGGGDQQMSGSGGGAGTGGGGETSEFDDAFFGM